MKRNWAELNKREREGHLESIEVKNAIKIPRSLKSTPIKKRKRYIQSPDWIQTSARLRRIKRSKKTHHDIGLLRPAYKRLKASLSVKTACCCCLTGAKTLHCSMIMEERGQARFPIISGQAWQAGFVQPHFARHREP